MHTEQNSAELFLMWSDWSRPPPPWRQINRLALHNTKRLQIFLSCCHANHSLLWLPFPSSAEECVQSSYLAFRVDLAEKHTHHWVKCLYLAPMDKDRKWGSLQCFPSKGWASGSRKKVRKTRIARKGMRFVFVTLALSSVLSILFEGLEY